MPVIVYRGGAIPKSIDTRCAYVIDVNSSVPYATGKLIEWFESLEIFMKKSCGAMGRF